MRKKYYGYFIYDDHEYVIRFKIDGSLQWDKQYGCFMDKDWYVRTPDDMICLAALDTNPHNNKHIKCCYLLTKKWFNEYRAQGISRWTPMRETIKWD